MSIERGRDPRDYALVAFGGAGPIHACRLARALGVKRVIVPAGAGVGSAIGMLDAEPQVVVSLTQPILLDGEVDDMIADCFGRLERDAATASGHAEAKGMRRHAFLRYAGQGYELRVELPPGPVGVGYGRRISQRFHEVYQEEYGYSEPEAAVEAVDWYLTVGIDGPARESSARRRPRTTPPAASESVPTPDSVQPAYFPEDQGDEGPPGGGGRMIDCPVFERAALKPGVIVNGPALLTDPETTILVPPGDQALIDPEGNVLIDIDGPF